MGIVRNSQLMMLLKKRIPLIYGMMHNARMVPNRRADRAAVFEEMLIPERETGRLNLTLLLAVAAALGSVLVLARQVTYGVGLHWDSGSYVAAARHLLEAHGFRDYSGGFYVRWPPLYPLLLAVVSFDLMDPLDVAGPVNAVLFGLIIFLVGRYLRSRLASRFLVGWTAFTIALARPLAEQAALAMSDTAFILLVMLTLIRAEAFLVRGRTSALVWAGVWAALAWQTRYVGGALLAAVAVMLLSQRGARPAQRVRRAAGFLMLAGAPMAAWLVRNRLVSGLFFGPRGGFDYSLPTVVTDTGELLWTLAASFDFPLVEWPAAAWLGLLSVATLAAAGGMLIRGRWQRRTPADWLPCCVFGGFALAYLTGLVIYLSLGNSHGVEERYLSPLYVPLLVAAAFALDRVLGFAPRRRLFWRRYKPGWKRRAGRAAAAMVTAALSFFTAGQIEPNVREIRQSNSDGSGYASQFWAGSATVEWIRLNPLDGLIISNDALAVSLYNYANEGYLNLPGGTEDMQEFLRRWRRYGVDFYVVWFDDEWINRETEYSRADLHAAPGLQPVAELADGAVFKTIRSPDTE